MTQQPRAEQPADRPRCRHPRSRPRPVAQAAALLGGLLGAALVQAACGPYDTAAYRVPHARVRTVETLDLPPEREDATTSAATRPVPTTLPAESPPERPLTLADVRELALRNNLDLRVSRLDPRIAAEGLRAEEAAFDAVFTTDVSYAKTDQPTASQLEGSSVEDVRVTPGLLLPLRTGGTIELGVPFQRFETSNEFSTLNPSFSSELRGIVTQPLGRGFGTDVAEQRIRIATAQLGQALVRQKLDVIEILSSADRTYWLLYAAARAVAVEEQQYALAVQQLERAPDLERAGAQPLVEITRAESSVADARERLIRFRQLERERQRQLKRILNDPKLPIEGGTRVTPGTGPDPRRHTLDAAELEQAALSRRMELLEAELRIAEETANILSARNGLLPRADLRYQWNSNGLGGDLGDSLDQTRTLDYQDHIVGVNFEFPLGNREARARYRAAILRRLQQLATKEARVLQVRQEVYDAADRLETGWEQILAARQRVDLAARLYEAERRRFDIGLATGLEVETAQANLASAQFAEIEAVTNYEISRVDLAVATGTVIGKNRVELETPDTRR